jgi:hypothetical protein
MMPGARLTSARALPFEHTVEGLCAVENDMT